MPFSPPALPTTQPLVGILHRMSRHLDDLAARVYHVEHAIGDEFSTSGPQATATIQRLQTLDLLRQSLEDLSLLVLFVSQTDGIESQNVKGIEKLANRLSLDATKALLTPKFCPARRGTLPFEEGDVDLF